METRKQFHLTRDSYFGQQIYFVTICSTRRRPVFRNSPLAAKIIGHLKTTAKTSHFLLHAWCLMPDHLHILAEGIAEDADLFSFIGRFKRRTTNECASGARADKSHRPLQLQKHSVARDRLWQRNFYEHIVRNREGLARIASYIWMNPVRKGICLRLEDYSFSGSLTFPWKQVSTPAGSWSPPWKHK